MTYRERAQAALTHPATFVALATLLLNDLALKWIWQGAWFTGKLSDLAWLVFAAPLLAFALSFAARGNVRAQRWTWRVAYIGLPLLYFAYNSIAPLHDAIMSAFSLARGTPGASPFDPTDSIVIPFGSAIALWIWRRSAAAPKPNLRLRSSAFMAVVASLATIATSYAPPINGITTICHSDNARGWEASASNARIVLEEEVRFKLKQQQFEESSSNNTRVVLEEAPMCGGKQVETPRGTFRIQGDRIVRSFGGETETAFTATVFNKRADTIAIEAATAETLDNAYRIVTINPLSIYYSRKSDEVVAAMGLQGVVVGTADGKWTREGVGRFQPIDLSVFGRIKNVLTHSKLMSMAFALSGTLTALALLFAGCHKRALTKAIGAIFSIIPFIMAGYALVNYRVNSIYGKGIIDDLIVGICVFALMLAAVALSASHPSRGQLTAAAYGFAGMAALFLFAFFIWMSGAIELTAAKAYAISAMAVVAIALCVYLRSDPSPPNLWSILMRRIADLRRQ